MQTIGSSTMDYSLQYGSDGSEVFCAPKAVEASLYMSRKCDDKCLTCNAAEAGRKELSVEEWMDAVDMLKNIGIENISVLLGSLTAVPNGMGGLIRHINGKQGLEYSVVSNFILDDASICELVDAGLRSYTAGVTVFNAADGSFPVVTSSAGMIMLERMKYLGVKRLQANLTASRKNLGGIVNAAKYLSNRGIWVNVSMAQGGLDEEQTPMLIDMASGLLRLKHEGALIAASEDYLTGLPAYGAGFSWKCCETRLDAPPRIVVDSDGALKTCVSQKSAVLSKTVFDLVDAEHYAAFVKQWQSEAIKCMGCYWPSMFMARQRQDIPENIVKVA